MPEDRPQVYVIPPRTAYVKSPPPTTFRSNSFIFSS